MGEANIGRIEGIDTNTNGTAGSNPNDPSTQGTETKRRGRPPGTGTKTRTEETELLGLASLEGPKPVAVEIPTPAEGKKRGRPKKQESENNVTIPKVDSMQIQLLLVTISGVIASRPGMEIWNLSTQEAKQISDPLANILSKNAAVAAISNEHADAIALVVACFMVFLPKALLYISTKPKKPKDGETVNYEPKRNAKPAHEVPKTPVDSGANAGERTRTAKNASKNFGGQLYELIPSVGGI
jgi:hypothetical protein